MLVIPAVDIKESKVVRIIRGDPRRTIISIDDPVEVSKKWFDRGARLIHIVDLDAALGFGNQFAIVEKVLRTGVKATVGGGIRDFKAAQMYIECGAWAVVISTMIFENPPDFEKLVGKYPDKVIVALDFDEDFRMAIRGWTEIRKKIFELDDLFERNFKGYLFTSIFRDGTSLGISKKHFTDIAGFNFGANKIKIASGGICSREDLVFLRELGFWGAVVGRAFYEGKIDVFEI